MNQMPKKGTSFRCLVVQADIPQSRAATIEQVNYAMSQHYTLTNDALKEISDASRENFAQLVEGNELNQAEVNFSGKPDLVVWPETGIPISYHMRHPLGSEYRRMVYNLTKRYSTKFFLGTLDYLPGSDQSAISYNAAFLLDQYAAVKSKYYKKHLVPFGEFVPFADQMPWLVDMIGMGRGLIPGESSEPVELKSGIRAGVSICFEDAFPYISRDQVLRGANLLLTITNDAWYPKSDEPVQHLANSIFRAVEMRRTVIRSGNNSASCVISPAGIVIDSVLKSEDGDLLLKSKGQGTAVFSVVVEDKPRLSFYARYGDLFIGCCLILVGFAFVLSIIKWKRKKSDVIKAFEDC